MTTTTTSSLRLCRAALFALGCSVGLVALQPSLLNAADAPAAHDKAAADKAPSLPVTGTFEKVSGAENGPYVLHLKNDSKDTIKVSAKVLLSVAYHAESKARMVPEHAIEAGKTWTVPNLAAGDKVILTAHGHAPLELTVK